MKPWIIFNVYLLTGIALLGFNTDLAEAHALMHQNNIVDIYTNSWGPFDFGFGIDGPGPVTQLALKYGTQEVMCILDHLPPHFGLNCKGTWWKRINICVG